MDLMNKGQGQAPAGMGDISVPRSGAVARMLGMPVPLCRWDDAALADFAVRSSMMACECPRHVAELLAQLSHFEAYSAECEHRSTADAELHAHLRHVAVASRGRFEAALEHVALHEGLLLPPASPAPPGPGDAAAGSSARRPRANAASRSRRRC
jgi:hypothetical protein